MTQPADEQASPVIVRQLQPDEIDAPIAARISELTSRLSERPISLTVDEARTIAAVNYLEVAIVPERQEIAGMACLVTMRLPQGIRFLIETVIVDEAVRGRGIGKALIAGLLTEAARHDATGHVSLTCNDKRPDAYQFYSNLGFEKASTSVLRRPIVPML